MKEKPLKQRAKQNVRPSTASEESEPALAISTSGHEAGEETASIARPFTVVAIGASAGGLEALQGLLANLPANTGMAYVVIQHLDPTHPSQSPDVLRRISTLPVVEARQGMKLKPDSVAVMPSNVVMTLMDGHIRLTRRSAVGISMPVDAFFRSLAEHHQNRSIGIVLSGNGVDGTKGLEAIKSEGGVTFAQDEATAKYFGMPGSAIAAGVVDFVLEPAQMAAQLKRVARHPNLRRSRHRGSKLEGDKLDWQRIFQGKSTALASIFNLLRARTGVDFSMYKHTTLRRRIARRMVVHKIDGLPAYLKLMQNRPEEIDALFNDLLISVTTFFRDPKVFNAIKRRILPKIAKAHPAETPLRFWVCGCSTGEEAYSLAMTVVEYFEATRSHRSVQIFATDISESSIERARDGLYPESIAQNVSPERLRRFFVKIDGRYQIHKSIRDMCVFARQNVAVDPPFSNMDLISCRNMMIYLGSVLQQKIIPMFHYALRPHGFLLLGTSETIGDAADLFTLENKKLKFYSKKAVMVRTALEIGAPSKPPGAEIRPVSQAKIAGLRESDIQQQADKILLRDFSPAAVVINAQMEVLHFRGRTGEYLEHAQGAASLNLLKMARDSMVIELRSAVLKAIKQNTQVQQKGVQLRSETRRREIDIDVIPFRLGSADDRLFLVLFKETPPWKGHDANEEAAGPLKPAQEKRATSRLRQELSTTKDSLQSIIEEQEATNEELKSANEEIQSSNEELQSTNEELETAKEELQSTNEELTTLNEELQNRNGELTGVNNDLTNLLGSVNIAILMLGNDLVIRRFTPMAERLFNLIPSDMGRRLSDMNRTLLIPELESWIKDVIDNLKVFERDVQDRDGRWYSLRIRPYRTRENRIEGAVILLVDIDELKRALDTVASTVDQPLLVLDADFSVKQANESLLKTFGLKREEVDRRRIYDIGNGLWNFPKLHTLLEAVLPENKVVNGYELEIPVADGEKVRSLVEARLFYEESRGMRLTLLVFDIKS